MPTQVLKLPATIDAPVEWVAVDTAGQEIGVIQHGSLTDFAAQAAGSRILAMLPASQVLRVGADVPLKGATKIRQALPYALEEQLAGDVEQQHFACSNRDAAGRIPTAVVTRQLLRDWLEQLHSLDLKPTGVYAESDGVATAEATLTVFIDNDVVVTRSPDGEIAVVDEGSLQTILELLLDQQAEQLENDATVVPINILVYCDTAAHVSYQELWDRLRIRTENVEVRILADGALNWLAGPLLAGNGVNLLQGEFAPKTELPFSWQQWRVAALLLAGFLLLNLAYTGLSYWQLSRADAALDGAAKELLQATFAAGGDSRDPWGELRTRLGNVEQTGAPGAQAIFGGAVETLAKAFAATPGLRMETLSYRSGTVDLQLIAPDVAALDKLRQQISVDGRYAAEIQSANPSDDVIKGRIQITAADDS